jgi:hypothetical protein
MAVARAQAQEQAHAQAQARTCRAAPKCASAVCSCAQRGAANAAAQWQQGTEHAAHADACARPVCCIQHSELDSAHASRASVLHRGGGASALPCVHVEPQAALRSNWSAHAHRLGSKPQAARIRTGSGRATSRRPRCPPRRRGSSPAGRTRSRRHARRHCRRRRCSGRVRSAAAAPSLPRARRARARSRFARRQLAPWPWRRWRLPAPRRQSP